MKKSIKRNMPSATTVRAARPLLLGLLILAIVAAILIPLYLAGRNMMSASSSTPLTAMAPGSLAKVVCVVTSIGSDDLLKADYLARNSDGSYSRTGQTVSIRWKPEQGVVMGSSQDVHQGATIQVNGSIDGNNIIQAKQIIMLTGSITVR